MATYLVLFCSIVLLGNPIQQLSINKSKSDRRILLFIVIVLLVVFAGLRGVGADYGNYTRLYHNLKIQSLGTLWQSVITFDEPGLKIICILARVIYDDPTTMFFICSFLSITPCVILISKENVNFCFAITLYFLLVWNGTFGAIRQYLAGAMIFCAYPYLREKKFWKYCVFIILGATFHITALIMIPVYFLVANKVSWKRTLLIVVVSFILRYSYDFLFSLLGAVKDKTFGNYAYFTTEVNILRILVAFAPIVLFLLIPQKRRTDKNLEQSELNNLDLAINIILMNAAFMFATAGSAYLARVVIYTSIFFPLVIPEITKQFDKGTKSIIIPIMVVCYLLYFIYGVYAQNLQYIFFFQR